MSFLDLRFLIQLVVVYIIYKLQIYFSIPETEISFRLKNFNDDVWPKPTEQEIPGSIPGTFRLLENGFCSLFLSASFSFKEVHWIIASPIRYKAPGLDTAKEIL